MSSVNGSGVVILDRDGGDSVTVTGGKLDVNATLSTASVNIGDVDVLSVPAPLNVTGGGTESAALRVTLANDSTGLVSIDDGGGSLTIDGTVSVNAHHVTNAGTFAVQSTLQAGSAAIGKLAANSGIDIGDVDVTSTVQPAGSGTFITYPQDTSTTSSATVSTLIGLSLIHI